MKLLDLPADIINILPHYFNSIYDLYNVLLTCRTLYNAYADTDIRLPPILPRPDGQLLFQPHPHLLLTGVARQIGDWAVSSPSNRYELYRVLLNGYDGLLSLTECVTRVSLSDLRRLQDTKYSLLNPLTRLVDFEVGPAMVRNQDMDPDEYGLTICQCPDIVVINHVIYCELFHHYIDDILASSDEPPIQATSTKQEDYLDCKEDKFRNANQNLFVASDTTWMPRPLETGIRRRFIAYCLPDVNNHRNPQHRLLNNAKDGQQLLDYVQMSHCSGVKERDVGLIQYWQTELMQATAEDTYNDALNPRIYPSDKRTRLFLMAVGHLGWLSLRMLLLDGLTSSEVKAKLSDMKAKIKAVPEELVKRWDSEAEDEALVLLDSRHYKRSWLNWRGLRGDCDEGIYTMGREEEIRAEEEACESLLWTNMLTEQFQKADLAVRL